MKDSFSKFFSFLFLSRTPIEQWYSITYMYWSIIGTFVTVFVGTTVSFFTASKDDTYEAKLLHPLIVKCLNFMPGEPREFKQPPPLNLSSTTVDQDTVTVEVVLDKPTNGHDNFAYEKEVALAVGGDQEMTKSRRIKNMTIKPSPDHSEGASVVETRRIFYSPETTGVYKQYEDEAHC